MLKIERLTFGATDARPLGTDFSLELAAGEIGVVTGSSGIGKTTLLRAVAGLAFVSAGTVWCDGVDKTEAPLQRRGLAYMQQDFPLFDELTVAENIQLRHVRFGRSLPAPARSDAVHLIRKLGLPGAIAARTPDTLSGGERQRVALARVLASSQRLLLLDEPFSNLDRTSKAAAMRAILEYVRNANAVAIAVCHDDADALILGDLVVLPPFAPNGPIVSLRGEADLRALARATGFSVPAGIQELSGEGFKTETGHPPAAVRFTATDVILHERGDEIDPAGSAIAEAEVEKHILIPAGILSVVRLCRTGARAIAFTAGSTEKPLFRTGDRVSFMVPTPSGRDQQ